MKVVTTPGGTRWRIGRRWLPWEPRLRKVDETLDLADVPDGCMHLDLDDIFVGIGILLALVLFVLFVVPVLIALAELLLLALLVVAGVLVRVLLRRPWIVDAIRDGTGERHSWKVVGWRRSGELVEALTTQISSGQAPRGL